MTEPEDEGLWLDLKKGERLLGGVDTSREPIFTVSEAAKIFFKRNADWLRWQERSGKVEGDHDRVGRRQYNLNDIEEIVWALGDKKKLHHDEMGKALLVVQAEAMLYGYICPHGISIDQRCIGCVSEEEAVHKGNGRRSGKR